jgi:hypothetical protein
METTITTKTFAKVRIGNEGDVDGIKYAVDVKAIKLPSGVLENWYAKIRGVGADDYYFIISPIEEMNQAVWKETADQQGWDGYTCDLTLSAPEGSEKELYEFFSH